MKTKLKILWASDLHLDGVDERDRKRFFARVADANFDLALISGDISDSTYVCDDLSSLAQACNKRHCCFVLGNHDFHHSTLAAVDDLVDGLCRRTNNLHHLGKGDFHQISDHIGLVGHRGWSDGRAGSGIETKIESFDSQKISDFRGCSREDMFQKMEKLGRQSGRYLKRKLPDAFRSRKHVICVTHFPLYYQAARYRGKPCRPPWQPYFVNQSAGLDVLEVKRSHPQQKMTVLCGHTHWGHTVTMRNNIEVKVRAAVRGKPDFVMLNF